MGFRLPLDDNGNAVPCITLKPGKAHKVAFNAPAGAAVKNTNPFADDTVVISLYADADIYIKFLNGPNDPPATTADHFYPQGVYYNFHLGGQVGDAYAAGTTSPNYKYISILGVTGSGNAYISECL